MDGIYIKFQITPRNAIIAQLVQDCADGKLSFESLCEKVAAMSLHEMVLAVEQQHQYDEMTRKAGGNPATHSCPHGMSCDIHG